ncbi:SusC/RagA family TonB-linked outer membrane protein [Solitalea canadensis]|uniref:TonB-linked outer membrane protein, SusC/RagA family n=1 Tax=Solitalea canadensis (strain ATCC 29591 / DSM 3403 / JCM 21819 / LMG 8368 / NBRC 15130 / NCIMB 12057 / USAM 9D) TaxID=929556 RepID=H8KLY6_SOLCM|nr:SusC/RagA family TonB-linked outer membrane protein [Solitalea canadensis]AFD08714.1 TonB-linked outer membrane protein, SusC/RagA family [Solitalea canadensis DSM 3403]
MKKYLQVMLVVLLLVISATALAQQRTVTGTVISSDDKQPLPSVTVLIKGTNIATQTDLEGKYSIKTSDGATLVFSYVGYTTREVTLGSSNVIDVTLVTDSRMIGEVVVTALGIKKEARSVGYATGQVKGDELTQAREVNVANALAGKVAGVSVASPASGPGGAANVIIRGSSSLTGSSQPLYVLNGVPMNNSNSGSAIVTGAASSEGSAGQYGGADLGDGISNINPDDIESISVLKGAAAAALYGSRAGAGVIMITTKSGKAQKGIGVDFNSTYQIDEINDFTNYQYEYGSGHQGLKPTTIEEALNDGASSWGARLDGSNVIQLDGVSRPYVAQKNNIKDFYRTGGTFTNTIALTGGTETATFRFSASKMDNTGVIPNSYLDRWSFNLGSTAKLGKKITANVVVNYTVEDAKNRPNLSDAPGNSNFGIAFVANSIQASQVLAPGYHPDGSEIQFTGNTFTTNPYFAAEKFVNNTHRNRIIANASLRWNILDWLYIQGRVVQDAYNDRFTNVTPTGTAYREFGDMRDNSARFSELNADALVGISHTIAKDLTLDASVGANMMKRSNELTNLSGSTFSIPFLYTIPNTTSKTNAYFDFNSRINSVYATADLAYRSFLYLNLSLRNDWYSTLASPTSDKISYLYPAVSSSFVFSEFLKSNTLSYGKVRVGYAEVGGGGELPYQTTLTYNIAGTINGVPIGQIANGSIPNAGLKPRAIKEFEAGTEVKFFQNRLGIDLTYYNKQINDDIVPVTTSVSTGYPSAVLNVGKLKNTGWELMLTGTPIKNNDFTWNVSFNGSVNNSEVVSLASDLTSIQIGIGRTETAFIQQIVGKEASQVMAFDYSRDESGNILRDANGVPLRGNLIAYGSGNYKYNTGLSNEFYYKRFNLSFLIDGKWGAKIFSGTNAYATGAGLTQATLIDRDKSGFDAQSYYANFGSNVSGQFVEDASFIKLRQVILGYDFPLSMFNNKIQGLKISFVARNLAVLMKHTSNIDPESNYNNSAAQGLELAGVPSTRSFGLNLNFKF